MKSLCLNLIARKIFQPIWETALKIVVRGMGYNNYNHIYNGEYLVLKSFFETMRNRDLIVFDVGANEGDFTFSATDIKNDVIVYAFEPHPATYVRLKERFKSNARVHALNIALSDKNGTVSLYDYCESDGSPHASCSEKGINLIQPVASEARRSVRLVSAGISSITIDYFIDINNIDVIDYLKIDVEGHEKQVLRGAERAFLDKRIRVVQIEVNCHNAIAGLTIYQMLQIMPHYELYKILPDGLYKVTYSPIHEQFRYGNFLFVLKETS